MKTIYVVLIALGTRVGENFRAKAKQNYNIEISMTDSDKLKLDAASTLCDRFLNQVKLGIQQK